MAAMLSEGGRAEMCTGKSPSNLEIRGARVLKTKAHRSRQQLHASSNFVRILETAFNARSHKGKKRTNQLSAQYLETCELAGDSWTCRVPEAKTVCCDTAKAIMQCGENETCYAVVIGQMLPDLKDEEDVWEFCPALAAFSEDAEDYCTGTSSGKEELTTCELAGGNWSCTVPLAKTMCCDFVKLMGSCDGNETCEGAAVEDAFDYLADKGFCVDKMKEEGGFQQAFMDFCPAMAAALLSEDRRAEMCTGKSPSNLEIRGADVLKKKTHRSRRQLRVSSDAVGILRTAFNAHSQKSKNKIIKMT